MSKYFTDEFCYTNLGNIGGYPDAVEIPGDSDAAASNESKALAVSDQKVAV